MAAEPDPARVVDFSQMRVTMLADTLRDLVEQIKFTNSHVARLARDIAELHSDLNGFRGVVEGRFGHQDTRFDRIERDLRELRNDQLLQSNQILNAQQSANQALRRIEDLLEERPTPGET